MPIYCTEYLALNDVGRPCRMGGEIEAQDWGDAEKKAEVLGHTLLGELVGEVPAPELEGFCDEVQKQKDEAWLSGPLGG
jgi:hypothetical protein